MAKKTNNTQPTATATVKKQPKATGNLTYDEAVAGVLKHAAKARVSAIKLRKELVPFGNYAKLLSSMEENGLVKVVKLEADTERHVEITAKGRKQHSGK